MLTKYGALEILDKMAFFQGQRAGRELWAEKSTEIQDIDIDCFVRDIANLREYILVNATDTNVGLKSTDVVPRAEWISVEERLPDGNGVFFVSLKESGYENLVYFDVIPYADGEWRNLPDKFTVSHWMPLPEPPDMKGGAE